MPQIFVLEVVAADLHGPTGRLVLPPHRLEIPDQLPLLGVDRDRRLARLQRRPSLLFNLPQLRLTLRILLALPRLLIGVQPKPQPPQQLAGRPIRHLMPPPTRPRSSPSSSSTTATATPDPHAHPDPPTSQAPPTAP